MEVMVDGPLVDEFDDERRYLDSHMSAADTVRMAEREDAETIAKTTAVFVSFIAVLYQVLPQILASLHQSSEKSKTEIHHLEAGIKKSTLTAADLQKDLGWNGLKSAGVVMGASLLQFVPGCNETDKTIANLFANQVAPNIMGIFRSGIEADLTKANNQGTLLNNKYNLQASQEQTKGNQKQQIEGVADKAGRLLESASRAG